jgi:predicted transcriptional regulator
VRGDFHFSLFLLHFLQHLSCSFATFTYYLHFIKNYLHLDSICLSSNREKSAFYLPSNYLQMKQHTLHLLITLLQQHQKLSYSDIIAHFPQKNESTITRNLNLLLKSGKITKKKIGKNTFYTFISAKNLKEYFNIPFFDRPKVTYHPDFLEKYIPNETSFL